MVNKVLSRSARAAGVKCHDDRAVEACASQQAQFAALIGEPELRCVGAEKGARMGLKRHGEGRTPEFTSHINGRRYDRAMSKVDASKLPRATTAPLTMSDAGEESRIIEKRDVILDVSPGREFSETVAAYLRKSIYLAASS